MSNHLEQIDDESPVARQCYSAGENTAIVAPYGNTCEVSHLRNSQSPWVRAAQLPSLFCSWDLAYRCTSSGWLKPIIRGKRRTIYRLADVLACMRRIESGELPPRRS